jgi:hypothetical protein
MKYITLITFLTFAIFAFSKDISRLDHLLGLSLAKFNSLEGVSNKKNDISTTIANDKYIVLIRKYKGQLITLILNRKEIVTDAIVYPAAVGTNFVSTCIVKGAVNRSYWAVVKVKKDNQKHKPLLAWHINPKSGQFLQLKEINFYCLDD